ncbi:MAG: ABC transporter permease [Clostridiaceae bacterium]
MDIIINGVFNGFQLLISGNDEIFQIILLTIKVSGIATAISVLFGLPLGLSLALKDFYGKRAVSTLINFGMGLPPVVIGLLVSLFLWRYGPLGKFGLMYTPTAMIIAQALIAFPIVIGLSFSAILSINPKLRCQLLSMGATTWQANWILIKEAKLGLMAAIIAGFGRIISEVGASMMVGGNIMGRTRVLTTATMLEVSKGNYDSAMAISFILLFVTYVIVILLTYLQHNERSEK